MTETKSRLVSANKPKPIQQHVIGVISDTHGILRSGVIEVLEGADLIIHAGDIGRPEVLTSLRAIAPVVAIRGNVDRGHWAGALHETEVVEIEDILLYVIHDVAELDLDPAVAGFRGIISGHSHRPSTETRNGVFYLNPGSAGPRRFTFPVSVVLLQIRGGDVKPRFVKLK